LSVQEIPFYKTSRCSIDFKVNHGYIVRMTDEHFMIMCLKEAHVAFDSEEVPVGAIILSPEGKVVARAHNLTQRMNRPTAHAEMLAIDMAADAMENYRLVDCTLYVSMEPCIMCAGAIVEARIKRLVFGCFDAKSGAFGSLIDVNKLSLNHKVEVKGGLYADKSEALLKKFFKARRGTEVVITGPTRNRLYV
jgi:tRNA(adenine34) deaminase